jgi:uncharacterized membrane protein YfcA
MKRLLGATVLLIFLRIGDSFTVQPSIQLPGAASSPRSSPPRAATRLGVLPQHVINDLASLDVETAASSFQGIHTSLSLSSNIVLDAIQSEDRPFQYAFMFPTMALIATCCQLAGIGGAALLSPLFLLIFPLLGPDYPLTSAASAIASALLTEVFGFASGLSGFWRRGLVDWSVAAQYLVISMPFALLGAVVASAVASNTMLLRGVYAALMLGLATYLTLSESPEQLSEEDCEIPDDEALESKVRVKEAADGTIYRYLQPDTTLRNGAVTGSGAILTGLLGVGIGEVVLPQLVRFGCMSLPVAAGTSVAVVVSTALTAAVVQFISLASQVTTAESPSLVQGLVTVIPWSLVQFTIPGALVGGQIAPYLAARKVLDDETIEQFTAALFGVIGLAFAVKCITG